MGNIAIGAVNLVDASGTVVACVGEDAARPATKLQAGEIGDVFRTVDESSPSNVIVVTLAAEVELERFALALIKHNLQSSATYDLVFKDAAAATVLSVAGRAVNADGFWSTAIDGQHRNIAVYQRHAALTFKSVEITPSDATNPDGYFEIARLFLGELVEPAIGLAYGWSSGWTDPSERGEAPGGNMIHRLRRRYRTVSGELRWLTEAEAFDDFIATIDATAGKSGDCLVLPFRDQPTRLQKRMLWGPQESVDALANPVFQRYSRRLAFRERT